MHGPLFLVKNVLRKFKSLLVKLTALPKVLSTISWEPTPKIDDRKHPFVGVA